jgi:CBS domain-containing protein
VLAPLLIFGASIGAIQAHYLDLAHPAVWPLVSMAALMGGTMRSPLTSSIFAFELTYAGDVLPIIFVASFVAYGVTVLLLKRSILTEKVARRGHRLVREYAVDPYEVLRVGEVMEKNVVALPSDMKISEFSERLSRGDKVVASHYAFPIVDSSGHLTGIMTRADIIRAYDNDPSGSVTLQEVGTAQPFVTFPDELVCDAMRLMVLKNIGRLPVVAREEQGRVIGYLGRAQLIACRTRQIQEEYLREAGQPAPAI